MSNGYYTYTHRRNDTGEVFYVGKGKGRRAWDARSRNPHWHAIVGKYGYTVEIVATSLAHSEALRQERRLIKLYSREFLANLTDGGDGFAGYVRGAHTEEHKAKISAGGKGRRLSEETKAKMRKPKSATHCANISAATRGKAKLALRGRKRAPELVAQQALRMQKPVVNSMGLVFESNKAAVAWLRSNGYPTASAGNISSCCTGKLKTAYSFTWRYAP